MSLSSLAAVLTIALSGNPPDVTLAAALRAAISYDLEINGMIGNGNWLADLWYNAMSEKRTDHIRDLLGAPQHRQYRCTFTLFREGDLSGDLREAAVVPAPPAEAGVQHVHPIRHALVLAGQQRVGPLP